MKGITIKETPVTWREYYKSMKSAYTQKYTEWSKQLETLEEQKNALYNDIKLNYENHKENYHCDVYSYKEFVDNKYIDGELHRAVRAILSRFKDNISTIGCLQDLLKYAGLQKDVYNLEKNISLADKLIKMKMSEYSEILRIYFTAVHKRMILEGEGYRVAPKIGWICVNRFKIIKRRGGKVKLNYQATKENKRRIITEGKRPYSAEEAKHYKEQGLEYDGVEYRVFQNNEYAYELVIVPYHLDGDDDLEIKSADYWATELRDKNGDELIAMCNNDINAICELKLSLNQKLRLCNKVNPILYTKFIRNESEKSISYIEANRKNR